MRITGGRLRGRILLGPKDRLIRPTADRVREAVFNILGHDLSGHHVLDLFSGTGSLGLEALSRGAAEVVFIDNLNKSVDLIKKNVERCAHRHSSKILLWDLTKGIPWGHPFLKREFDLVFLDPPYRKEIASTLVEEMGTGNGLSTRARIVIETGKSTDMPSSISKLSRIHSRIYGDTKISIYEFSDDIDGTKK